jgi:hypothetical protein
VRIQDRQLLSHMPISVRENSCLVTRAMAMLLIWSVSISTFLLSISSHQWKPPERQEGGRRWRLFRTWRLPRDWLTRRLRTVRRCRAVLVLSDRYSVSRIFQIRAFHTRQAAQGIGAGRYRKGPRAFS